MAWWVHYEEAYGVLESWHGPFDSDTAERKAKLLSKTYDASDKFAEVIFGERGKRGRRAAEFYNGNEFDPGQSGWHDLPLSEEVDIPANAGE
jgi:hypothetical protein